MDIKVRALQVEDIFTVARMLGKVTKGAREQLVLALKGKKVDPTEFGVILVQSFLIEVECDLKDWLASLINSTTEEFKVMPATAILDIVEQLSTQDGSKDFFVKASQLAEKLMASPIATKLSGKG